MAILDLYLRLYPISFLLLSNQNDCSSRRYSAVSHHVARLRRPTFVLFYALWMGWVEVFHTQLIKIVHLFFFFLPCSVFLFFFVFDALLYCCHYLNEKDYYYFFFLSFYVFMFSRDKIPWPKCARLVRRCGSKNATGSFFFLLLFFACFSCLLYFFVSLFFSSSC